LLKRSKRKAGRVVKRVLADGTVKEYRYAPYRPKRRRVAADSVTTLIAAYRRSPEWEALRPQTRVNYAIHLRPLEEVGHLPVKGLNRRALLIIRDGVAKGRGNGAGTGFMRAASALFGWAVDHDWIEHTPVHRIKKLPGGHLRAWTRAEADAAAAALPEHLRRVVVLARYTGQWRADLCAMTWAAYDGATIRLTQQKTGAVLVIPCHPALRAELDHWKRAAAAVTILTNTLGRPWMPQHLSHELPGALVKIGLPRDLNVHGLRKLASAELADAGCSTHEIAAITGHRTLSMIELYTRSADQERLAGAAVVKLSAHTIIDKRRKVQVYSASNLCDDQVRDGSSLQGGARGSGQHRADVRAVFDLGPVRPARQVLSRPG
jgi:integrase